MAEYAKILNVKQSIQRLESTLATIGMIRFSGVDGMEDIENRIIQKINMLQTKYNLA